MAKLVVRRGRNIGGEYKLNADRLVMGRRSACPIPILDPKSSREHAVILRKNGSFFVQDLSRNGTFVNGKQAGREDDPTELKFGDQIKIGDTVLEVVDEKNEPINIEIPGYKILEKIGIGGMGIVYKAKQLSMDRIVALKVLNEKYSNDRDFVDRFIREARAAGKLNHPNVIHVHDVSKANGRHYFSMEYIDGSSVKEMLRIQGQVPVEKGLDIVIQTAKALEFAHENGIVHRDIKPDNIMLTRDGVVKIADLGIAKTFEESTGDAKQNRRVMGTPHYMAPEQALGKDIDHRVDIYSLGATCYHMLTGTTPFSGSTAHEVLKAHIQESLPPIQEYQKDVPDAVCFVVERMMAKLPEKRYPNMTRLIEDMERAQKGAAEGIERIAAGDSTVMRAMSAEEAAAHAKKRQKPRPATESFSTGVQAPIKKMLFYVALVAIFLVVVGLVVTIARPKGGTANSEPPAPNGEPPAPGSSGAVENPAQPTPPVVSATNPEAEKLLGEAKDLLAADPTSAAAEAKLKDLTTRFAATTSAEEGKQLLAGIENSRRAAARQKVAAAVEEAEKFEAQAKEEKGQWQAIAAKWRSVLGQAQIAPDLEQRAQGKAEDWEKKVAAEAQRAGQEAFDRAAGDSRAALAQNDYDAARKPLQDFLAAHGSAPQKGDAQSKLAAIEAQSDQAFNEVKARAEDLEKNDKLHPIPSAIEAWNDYLEKVKDAKHRSAAEKLKGDLESRAAAYIQEVGGQIAEKVNAYDYEAAVGLAKTVQQRLAGMPLAVLAKGREDDLVLQRDLHAKLLAAIKKQTAGGPVELKEEIEIPRMGKQWAVAGAEKDRVMLSAVPSGPGVTKRFGDLKPLEQYAICKQFLGDLSKDDHLALAAFCKERGLNDDAALHETQAKQEEGPPQNP